MILLDGKLRVGVKHTIISNDARQVYAAGRLILNSKGRVLRVRNVSGHYPSDSAHNDRVTAIFKTAGFGKNIVSDPFRK